MSNSKSKKAKALPAGVTAIPNQRPNNSPSSLIVVLNFLAFFLETYKRYIGLCVVGIFLVLPALPDIKDMIKFIVVASPEQIRALGDALWEPVRVVRPFIISVLATLLLISVMANILFLFNNRRHIAKIGELRKELESLDPDRSSSGLDKYGERM